MIFSWKLQLDYDRLVLSPHSVRAAIKVYISFFLEMFVVDPPLKLIWKLDNLTLVSNNSSVWPSGCNKYFFGNFEISHFI